MKITIEFEGQVVSLQNPNVVAIHEALELCQRALLASGYCFKGELTIVEDDAEDSSD